jgi:protein-S-isoprenylcysteine O-methyltransferase Ste14
MLKLPPPVWAVLFVLAGVGICRTLGWPSGPHSALVGAVLAVFGWIPPIWAILLFRRAGTEVAPTSPANKALVTDGPYRWTRNPMYLGLVIVTLGIALWLGSWPMLLAPLMMLGTANFVHIPFEEAKMRRQFGEAYEAYTRKVRRWI